MAGKDRSKPPEIMTTSEHMANMPSTTIVRSTVTFRRVNTPGSVISLPPDLICTTTHSSSSTISM